MTGDNPTNDLQRNQPITRTSWAVFIREDLGAKVRETARSMGVSYGFAVSEACAFWLTTRETIRDASASRDYYVEHPRRQAEAR